MSYWLFQVTVQRYIAVCIPLRANTLASVTSVRKWVITACLMTALYSVPFFLKFEVFFVKFENMYYYRRAEWSETKMYDIFYDVVAYYTVLIILPVGILMFCTFKLIRALHESRRLRDSMAMQDVASKKSTEDVTLSLIVVVIIYVLCQILSPSRHIFCLFDMDSHMDSLACGSVYFVFNSIAIHLILVNCAANFFVLFFLSQRFRLKLRNKIVGILSCGKVEPPLSPQCLELQCPHVFRDGHPRCLLSQQFRYNYPNPAIWGFFVSVWNRILTSLCTAFPGIFFQIGKLILFQCHVHLIKRYNAV